MSLTCGCGKHGEWRLTTNSDSADRIYLSDIGTGGETAPVKPTARLVIYQSCDAAPTVARFAIRHSKLTYRLFRNTGNSLSLLKYLNAAVTHEGPAPATGHEVH